MTFFQDSFRILFWKFLLSIRFFASIEEKKDSQGFLRFLEIAYNPVEILQELLTFFRVLCDYSNKTETKKKNRKRQKK